MNGRKYLGKTNNIFGYANNLMGLCFTDILYERTVMQTDFKAHKVFSQVCA